MKYLYLLRIAAFLVFFKDENQHPIYSLILTEFFPVEPPFLEVVETFLVSILAFTLLRRSSMLIGGAFISRAGGAAGGGADR